MNKSALAHNLLSPQLQREQRRAYLKTESREGQMLRSQAWQKHDVMRALYELALGREHQPVDLDDLMNSIELPPGRVYNALDRLEQDGWIQCFNGSCIELLAPGVVAVQSEATKPYRIIDLHAHAQKSALKPGLAAGSGR